MDAYLRIEKLADHAPEIEEDILERLNKKNKKKFLFVLSLCVILLVVLVFGIIIILFEKNTIKKISKEKDELVKNITNYFSENSELKSKK